MNNNIEWLKCPHGNFKKDGTCFQCEQQRYDYLKQASQSKLEPPSKIAIKRGCQNKDGCFCTGKCNEIIGYRDPLFVGEMQH